MTKEKEEQAFDADDHYDDRVIGVDTGASSSARLWESPNWTSRKLFSGLLTPTREMSISSSMRYLNEMYEEKSDSKKGTVNMTVDKDRVHIPGDSTSVQIALENSVLDGTSHFHIEFKAEVRTYSVVSTGQATYVVPTKEQFFCEYGRLEQNDGSFRPVQKTQHFSLEQIDKSNPLVWSAQSVIPMGFYLRSSRLRQNQMRSFPAPSSFRDNKRTLSQAIYVSYVWKVTREVSGTFTRNERYWKPILVVASPPDVRRDPVLTAPLSYPPPSAFTTRLITKSVSKRIFGSSGRLALEIAMPNVETAFPLYRPIPVVLRITVRAKNPSALLERGGEMTLPSLPDEVPPDEKGKGKAKGQSEVPTFYIDRHTHCRAKGAQFEHTSARQPCTIRWDAGHIGNGFRPGSGSEGFEDGRDGSTRRASELAAQGRPHGWTWPERDPDAQTWTPNNPTVPSSEDARISPEDVQKYGYFTSATLFGYVYPDVGPRIELPKLRVYYDLKFQWGMIHNDIDVYLADLGVTMGIHPSERHLVNDEDLRQAVFSTPTFDPQGTFLQGVQPPPPDISSAEPGPEYNYRSAPASWLPTFANLLLGSVPRNYAAPAGPGNHGEAVPQYEASGSDAVVTNDK